jgi:hypothetical protein
MKLVEISNELLNEASKNPLSVFRSIFKAAGINFAEVEVALLLGLKQIDNKILSITKATPEQVEKAFKTKPFKKYVQILARNYIANNDKIIDGILKKFPSNSKEARAEIANTLKVNKSVADEIFIIKNPKPKPTPKSIPVILPNNFPSIDQFANSPNSLVEYIRKDLKFLKLNNMPKGVWEDEYLKELVGLVNKNLQSSDFKGFSATIDNLENTLPKYGASTRKQFYDEVNKKLYDVSKSNGSLAEWIRYMQFWKDPIYAEKGYFGKLKEVSKYILWINVITAGLDVIRVIDDSLKGKESTGHFNTTLTQTLAMKVGAAVIPRANVTLSTILLVESLIKTIGNTFNINPWVKDKSDKAKSGVLGDTPPSEDEIDFK